MKRWIEQLGTYRWRAAALLVVLALAWLSFSPVGDIINPDAKPLAARPLDTRLLAIGVLLVAIAFLEAVGFGAGHEHASDPEAIPAILATLHVAHPAFWRTACLLFLTVTAAVSVFYVRGEPGAGGAATTAAGPITLSAAVRAFGFYLFPLLLGFFAGVENRLAHSGIEQNAP